MPTGYTHAVQTGKVTTLRDFALSCARAFGACIMMRDEPADVPIPAEFQPETRYYDELEAQATATLRELSDVSPEDADARALADYTDAVAARHERRRKRAEERARYEAMLAQVEAWTPPTPEHDELKRFMARQLRESIDFDCDGRYDTHPVRETGADWLTRELADAERRLASAQEHRREEIARVAGRNAWVAALRASLPEGA